jgi:hypothetical protein
MDLFERFLAAENDFFAYFSYFPVRSRYPERHPIIDFRKCHWLLVGDGNPFAVCYSYQPMSGLKLEIGCGIFAEAILNWLGANSNCGSNGGWWRGPDYTLVAAGLPTEGPRRYLLLSNANECRNQILARQALAQTLA